MSVCREVDNETRPHHQLTIQTRPAVLRSTFLLDLQSTNLHTVKLLINAPGVYLNTDLITPAFNRDPAFIGDPASIRTLASTPLRLLMSVVPISPVYVNFTLHMLIFSVCVSVYLVS